MGSDDEPQEASRAALSHLVERVQHRRGYRDAALSTSAMVAVTTGCAAGGAAGAGDDVVGASGPASVGSGSTSHRAAPANHEPANGGGGGGSGNRAGNVPNVASHGHTERWREFDRRGYGAEDSDDDFDKNDDDDDDSSNGNGGGGGPGGGYLGGSYQGGMVGGSGGGGGGGGIGGSGLGGPGAWDAGDFGDDAASSTSEDAAAGLVREVGGMEGAAATHSDILAADVGDQDERGDAGIEAPAAAGSLVAAAPKTSQDEGDVDDDDDDDPTAGAAGDGDQIKQPPRMDPDAWWDDARVTLTSGVGAHGIARYLMPMGTWAPLGKRPAAADPSAAATPKTHGSTTSSGSTSGTSSPPDRVTCEVDETGVMHFTVTDPAAPAAAAAGGRGPSSSTSSSAAPIRALREERDLAEHVRRAHILAHLVRGREMHDAALDPLLSARCLSMGPLYLRTVTSSSRRALATVTDLRMLLQHFSSRVCASVEHVGAIAPLAKQEAARAVTDFAEIEVGGAPHRRARELRMQRLHDALDRRWGSDEDRAVLFASMCNAFGAPVRIVACFDPVSGKPAPAILRRNATERALISTANRASSAAGKGKGTGKGKGKGKGTGNGKGGSGGGGNGGAPRRLAGSVLDMRARSAAASAALAALPPRAPRGTAGLLPPRHAVEARWDALLECLSTNAVQAHVARRGGPPDPDTDPEARTAFWVEVYLSKDRRWAPAFTFANIVGTKFTPPKTGCVCRLMCFFFFFFHQKIPLLLTACTTRPLALITPTPPPQHSPARRAHWPVSGGTNRTDGPLLWRLATAVPCAT
jgi:hypothetical protein